MSSISTISSLIKQMFLLSNNVSSKRQSKQYLNYKINLHDTLDLHDITLDIKTRSGKGRSHFLRKLPIQKTWIKILLVSFKNWKRIFNEKKIDAPSEQCEKNISTDSPSWPKLMAIKFFKVLRNFFNIYKLVNILLSL